MTGSPAAHLNLYVHFPFCRRKCSYCALYSRAGAPAAERASYVRSLVSQLATSPLLRRGSVSTLYFGGGSPAFCDLSPLASALRPLLAPDAEFTVEVHPLDVTEAKLRELRDLGVNRLSMGVQSFDDAVLADMGRGSSRDEAERAFRRAKGAFDNVGIDLIAGYPGERPADRGGDAAWREGLARFREAGMRHCSVYSLQNERGLANVPDDASVLDRIAEISGWLRELGLERYEISNYAEPGYECRHNLAVWRGEDYVGLGEGAYGRIGLTRTVGRKSGTSTTTVTPERDAKERTLFRLRTREGLSAAGFPAWTPILDGYVREGLLTFSDGVYHLTARGTEVCDSILVDLV